MRRRARKKAQGEDGAWIVDAARIEDVLGAPRYAADEAEVEPELGTVTGLAWTADGGQLMTIEALRMPANPAFLPSSKVAVFTEGESSLLPIEIETTVEPEPEAPPVYLEGSKSMRLHVERPRPKPAEATEAPKVP